MKTTIMKKLHSFFAAIVLLSALGTSLGACQIPSADSVSAIPAGTINASFGTASSASARSAVPDLAAKVAVYVITCANTDVGTSETAEVSGSTSHQFTNVVPGKVKISVSAYNSATTKDATTLIATGESSITLGSGEGANVSIQLSMAATGASGKIELEIDWPTTLANTVTWTLDGNAQTPLANTPGTTTSSAKLTADASAGSHAMAITFKNGSVTVGTAIETVNVYANLTSNKWIDSSGNLADARNFTAADFAVTGTDFSVMVLCGTNTYQIAYYSTKTSDAISVPTGTTSITIIPTGTTAGQKIQYTYSSSTVTAQSGNVSTISSLLLPATITFDVTAPNGTSTQRNLTVNGATPINSATALADMELQLANNYVLTADINLSFSGTWTPIGSASTKFTGTFDGGGHTISNLTTTTTNGDAGLFGYISTGAVISNVRLKNVNVTSTGLGSGDDGIGGLVGENDGGTITRCSVSGSVTGYRYVGGLVGCNRVNSTVSECYSTAIITGTTWVGGLVGGNWATVSDCYARSSVTALDTAGGLLGHIYNTSTIINCFASSIVSSTTATNDAGGISGIYLNDNDGSNLYTNCFYDKSISINNDRSNAIAMTTTEMQDRSTYSGWNFASIWAINPAKNDGYPYLQNVVPDKCVTVSFDANGATSGSGPTDLFAIPGQYISIPTEGTLTKAGYTFAGWALDNSGNQNYMPGNRYMVPNDHLTLYAKWAHNLFSEDCESLSTGNLNGQGDWATTLHNTGVDMQVTAGAGTPVNYTKYFAYGATGAGVGVDCKHALNLGSTPINLTGPDIYRVSFDLSNSAWGDYAGLSYGSAYAVGVQIDGGTTAKLTLPNGTTKTYSLGSGFTYQSWWRVEITMFSNYITVQILSLETGEWFTPWNGEPLSTNSSATDKTNPANWDTFFGHMEGANCMLDNMRLEKQ